MTTKLSSASIAGIVSGVVIIGILGMNTFFGRNKGKSSDSNSVTYDENSKLWSFPKIEGGRKKTRRNRVGSKKKTIEKNVHHFIASP